MRPPDRRSSADGARVGHFCCTRSPLSPSPVTCFSKDGAACLLPALPPTLSAWKEQQSWSRAVRLPLCFLSSASHSCAGSQGNLEQAARVAFDRRGEQGREPDGRRPAAPSQEEYGPFRSIALDRAHTHLTHPPSVSKQLSDWDYEEERAHLRALLEGVRARQGYEAAGALLDRCTAAVRAKDSLPSPSSPD